METQRRVVEHGRRIDIENYTKLITLFSKTHDGIINKRISKKRLVNKCLSLTKIPYRDKISK